MPDDPHSDGLSKPPFRGCVFCYTAEMSVYGLRRGIRRVTGD